MFLHLPIGLLFGQGLHTKKFLGAFEVISRVAALFGRYFK
jgi:hypothetical protein